VPLELIAHVVVVSLATERHARLRGSFLLPNPVFRFGLLAAVFADSVVLGSFDLVRSVAVVAVVELLGLCSILDSTATLAVVNPDSDFAFWHLF